MQVRSKGRAVKPWGWVALALAVTWAVLAMPVLGNDARETFTQHALELYFDMPQNARTLGMAGGSVPTAADVSSVFGNPAGLAWLETPEMAGTYMFERLRGEEYLDPPGSRNFRRIDEDFHRGHAQLAVPLRGGEWGVLGGGLSMYRSDVDDSVDTDTSGWRPTLAYGLALGDEWSVGYGLTWLDAKHDNDFVRCRLRNGWRHALGVQYVPNAEWAFGLHGFYGHGDSRCRFRCCGLGTQTAKRRSWGVSLGGQYRASERWLLAAAVDYADYELDSTIKAPEVGIHERVDEDGRAWGVRLGTEYDFDPTWQGRLGYRYRDIDYTYRDAGVASRLSGDAGYHAASAGLGVTLGVDRRMGIDYAFEWRFVAKGRQTHAVTLSYRF